MLTIILFIISFITAIIMVLLFKLIAEKIGFYDIPKNNLKDHTKPIPYVGTAICMAFILVLLGLRLFTSFETGTLHQLRGIVYGGLCIYLLGLLDDIFDLNFKVKFLWQIIAAGILIYYGIYIKFFPSKFLNVAISMFWVVLVVNSVNIIDILDGLAVGVSAICALGFFMITFPTEMLYVNFAAIILFGVLLGFWVFNKPSAKVFMGDAGSLFTGFILAALSMGADYSQGNMLGLFAPLLVLGIPLYDTILVSYLRWKSGKPIFKGSKDHYALRLSVAGFSPWQVNLISYSISLLLGIAAFLIIILSEQYSFFVLVVVLSLGFAGSNILGNIDISEK